MKKVMFTAFAVGLGLTVNVMAQVPSYVPTNGLVGWFPFNGNTNDESGSGNNGTIIGSITPSSDRFGNPNKSYSFLGNGHVQLPSINLPSFTINAWVKRLPGVNGVTVVCKHYSSSVLNSSYLLFAQNTQNNYCAPYVYYTSTTNTPASIEATGSSWCDNNWHMLTGVLNSSSLKIYFDGVLINSSSGAVAKSTNFATLIGGQYSNSGVVSNQNFGQIDDIGFWNVALTQQEITALYQSCSNPNATISPQGSTTFCSGGSVNLNASTGNGYTYQWYRNGTIISNATASSYTATLAGNYTVVVNSNGCLSTSAITSVTVNPNPNVTLTGLNSFTNFYSSPVSLIGSPTGGTYSGLGVTGNTFNPSIAGLGVNSVNYSYTTAAGCNGNATQSTIVYDTLGVVCTTYDTVTTYISVTDTLIINTTLSLPAPNNENTILIYPNPASDHITIDNGNFAAMAGYSIKIENNAGQQVFQSAINQQQFYVDLSTWTGDGLYFVHLIDSQNNTVTVRKIVLQ